MNILKLEKEYSRLNKEYITLDKQNDNEKDAFVLESNYSKMDKIQSRMAEIANILENQ